MANVFDLLGMGRRTDILNRSVENEVRIHTEFQEEEIERDLGVLDASGTQAEKLQSRLAKSVQQTLEALGTESAKRIHLISRGFCPECGCKLKQHLYTNICVSCGWTDYTVPPQGPVRVHLEGGQCIEGDFCYTLKTGDALVIRDDVVIARIRPQACQWIEYIWSDDDVSEKRQQRLLEESMICSWCESDARADADEFSIIYAAFGAYQNRYIFCSKQCREAFLERYPARVHRNCFETDCKECRLCIKRYDTELDSYQLQKKYREHSEVNTEETS